ncbi:XorII short patch repair endonuclease [Neisseria shayeganii 871]|uniref:XorII short patch repair endonuclease n=1 Tax=Neisseria shayeganii 871 TaxID=1032488 RepID=G4CHP5_9NEIS|nr:XorII short patch repair endonuclease [Neisseria shayeganii 871]
MKTQYTVRAKNTPAPRLPEKRIRSLLHFFSPEHHIRIPPLLGIPTLSFA